MIKKQHKHLIIKDLELHRKLKAFAYDNNMLLFEAAEMILKHYFVSIGK